MPQLTHHYRGYAILPTAWADSTSRWYIAGRNDEQYQRQYRTLADAKAAIDQHQNALTDSV